MNFTQVIYDNYRKLIRDSKYRWLIILGSILYIVSPVDLLPDVFPIVGWIDDGVVMTLLVTEVSAILMEKIKAKRGGTAETSATEGTSENTIDVDSIQVK